MFVYSIPGVGYLSSIFGPGMGHCSLSSAQPQGICIKIRTENNYKYLGVGPGEGGVVIIAGIDGCIIIGVSVS